VRLSQSAVKSTHCARRRQSGGERLRGSFVAQETAEIGKRRTGNCELPVEDGGYSPSPGCAAHQQIAFAKVAVDQTGFAVEGGQPRRRRPYQVMRTITQCDWHALLQMVRCETQVDETRQGIRAFQQRRSDARSGSEPARLGKSELPDGGKNRARCVSGRGR